MRERVADGPIVVLTGAGISAESGIPTFRGADGFWTVGSRHYQAEEIATRAFFAQNPEATWSWYLYRRALCHRAEPNAAHRALVDLERAWGARHVLVTQNVDGLHLRAGSSPERTYQIHGNLHFMRCAAECRDDLVVVPESLAPWTRKSTLEASHSRLLHCDRCHAWMRPHVLWFDETYDEPRYRFDSTLRAVEEARLLMIVGTSGATTLPAHMASLAARRGIPILDIDPDDNPFARLAAQQPGGVHLSGRATEVVPRVVALLIPGAHPSAP